MSEKAENFLTLKWGTFKSWDFSNSEKGRKLLKEYFEIGSSMSAMMQNDTSRQKKIICELIDLCDSDMIYSESDGKEVSKAEAKEYVINHNRNYLKTK